MADVVENEEKEISLIVEDGSCVPNANCYVSLDYAEEYMKNTGHKDWATLSDNDKKAYLINATNYIDRTYGKIGWKGIKKYHRNQPLCFPRVELYDKDGFEVEGIPEELKKAVCEAGFISITTSLFSVKDSSGSVKKQKVDVLEVEYYSESETSGEYISRFTVLDYLLADFYKTKNDRSRVKRAIHTDLLGGRI
jgi:hypothetical protein